MKLLNSYDSITFAEKRAVFLEKKGIKTYISSRDSHNFGSTKTWALKVGLWIVHNRQFNDAIACYKNNKHTVVNTLSKNERNQSLSKNTLSKNVASIIIIKAGLKIIFLLSLIIYLLYLTIVI